jgi:hypothetical protein
MSEYRIRSTGEVKTQGQIRSMHPNVSLPKVWNANVNETLGIDPVLASPKPDPSGDYKVVVRNGVEQDANNNWVWAWKISRRRMTLKIPLPWRRQSGPKETAY